MKFSGYVIINYIEIFILQGNHFTMSSSVLEESDKSIVDLSGRHTPQCVYLFRAAGKTG